MAQGCLSPHTSRCTLPRANIRAKWRGRQFAAAHKVAATQGLTLGAQHLLGASRAIVPIEEATLERSGEVTVDRSNLTAAVSYNTPYAVRQHEDLSLRHDPGRQAKYLEGPLRRETRTITTIISRFIRQAYR